FLMGVTIRHYFNTMHATGAKPNWTWAATAIIFVIIMWLSTAPGSQRPELQMSAIDQRFASAQGFEEASNAVVGRCSMCHTAEPSWPGIHRAPKGVMLDTPQTIAQHAREIYLQAGRSHAMPPGNVTEIEPAERKAIVDWYRAAVAG
ncbi:MAG: cysteine desulfurase, partial [Amaricoccus sp.]